MAMSPINYVPQPHGPAYPTRTTEQPEQRTSKYDKKAVEIHHPAFGVLQLNRSTWSLPGTVLTGSALHHASTISITLSRAIGERAYGDERFHSGSGDAIVSIEMSEAQWARFIASSGIGSGVPCTLRAAPDPDAMVDHFIPYIGVPETPHHKANEDAMARAAMVITKSREARAMMQAALAKPSVTKADIKAAMERLDLGIQHFQANEAFHLQQFQKVTDHMVADAKSEVEAFVNRVATNTGLLALKDGAAPVLMLPETHHEQGD